MYFHALKETLALKNATMQEHFKLALYSLVNNNYIQSGDERYSYQMKFKTTEGWK